MHLLEYLSITSGDLVFYHFLASSALFLIVLAVERNITSFTVTATIIMLHELAAIVVNPHIYAYAFKPGIFNTFSWYALWAFFNLAAVCLIYFSHLKLRLRVTNACLFYCGVLLFLTLLQFVQYLNTATVKSDLIIDFYSSAIFVCNIVSVPIFVLLWVIEKMKQSKSMTMLQAKS